MDVLVFPWIRFSVLMLFSTWPLLIPFHAKICLGGAVLYKVTSAEQKVTVLLPQAIQAHRDLSASLRLGEANTIQALLAS